MVPNPIPIGRFAALTVRPVKALRLYDRRDLLRPALVGFRSRFRCYTGEQVSVGQHIHLLRSLDMPFDDVCALLDAFGPEQMRQVVERDRQRVVQRVAHDQHILIALYTLEAQCEQARKEQDMRLESTPH